MYVCNVTGLHENTNFKLILKKYNIVISYDNFCSQNKISVIRFNIIMNNKLLLRNTNFPP